MKAIRLSIMGGLCIGAVLCAFSEERNDDVSTARAALEKWVETRKIISQEQRDWTLGEEMLNERIELIRSEIGSLRAKIAEAKQTIETADQKREHLLAENTAFKEASDGLAESLAALEIRTRSLLQKLPDPIRERVKPLSQRLPEPQGQTKLSISERFQNIVGILNEVNKFHREISLTSEVRALPDGASAEVTAVYVGVSQGYYASADGQHAGFGTASKEGWVWTPANQMAPEVAKIISILKNEQVAEFVALPVALQ